jgi:hypothetical protein
MTWLYRVSEHVRPKIGISKVSDVLSIFANNEGLFLSQHYISLLINARRKGGVFGSFGFENVTSNRTPNNVHNQSFLFMHIMPQP